MSENKAASTASLAQSILMGLDRTKENTTLPTAVLDLICRTIIDLSLQQNATARAVQNAHAAFVQSKITGSERR